MSPFLSWTVFYRDENYKKKPTTQTFFLFSVWPPLPLFEQATPIAMDGHDRYN